MAVLPNFGFGYFVATICNLTYKTTSVSQPHKNVIRQPAGTPLEGRRSHGLWADEFHNPPGPLSGKPCVTLKETAPSRRSVHRIL